MLVAAPEPSVQPLDILRADQKTGELHDPVDDGPVTTGGARYAVDLSHTTMLTEWGQ